MKQAFDVFDADGSGAIASVEIYHMLKSLSLAREQSMGRAIDSINNVVQPRFAIFFF